MQHHMATEVGLEDKCYTGIFLGFFVFIVLGDSEIRASAFSNA